MCDCACEKSAELEMTDFSCILVWFVIIGSRLDLFLQYLTAKNWQNFALIGQQNLQYFMTGMGDMQLTSYKRKDCIKVGFYK